MFRKNRSSSGYDQIARRCASTKWSCPCPPSTIARIVRKHTPPVSFSQLFSFSTSSPQSIRHEHGCMVHVHRLRPHVPPDHLHPGPLGGKATRSHRVSRKDIKARRPHPRKTIQKASPHAGQLCGGSTADRTQPRRAFQNVPARAFTSSIIGRRPRVYN